MCGASEQQKAAFENLKGVSSQLSNSFNKIFGTNTSILKNLSTSLTPIVAAGPGQFGFTPEEAAALRTGATEEITQAGKEAANKMRSALAARGGGNVYLPSGSEASIEGALAQDTAQKQAAAQLGITEKGYDVGRQQYFNAIQELGAAPGQLESPITSAGGAAGAGAEAEMKGGTEITQANQAWMAPVAGLIGGIGGGLLGKLGTPKTT